MNKSFKENFIEFWIPIYKRQYFKFMLTNDKRAIVELEDNIWRNWNLSTLDKKEIIKKVRGIK